MTQTDDAKRRVQQRQAFDKDPGNKGLATPLWNEAHEYANGSRDDMWHWLETEYLNLALTLSDPPATTPSVPNQDRELVNTQATRRPDRGLT